MRHYWRGVWDGDGWITKGSCGKEWQVGVCGSKPVVEAARVFAMSVCGTTASLFHKPPIWTFKVGGRPRPRNLVQALYGGASVSLDRKRERALELCAPINDGKIVAL